MRNSQTKRQQQSPHSYSSTNSDDRFSMTGTLPRHQQQRQSITTAKQQKRDVIENSDNKTGCKGQQVTAELEKNTGEREKQTNKRNDTGIENEKLASLQVDSSLKEHYQNR